MKELIKKGYYDPDQQIIYHTSTKNINEIQKPKRKSANNENRINAISNSESTSSENKYSNNIRSENNVEANASTHNINNGRACASTSTTDPRVKKKKEHGYDFETMSGEFNF